MANGKLDSEGPNDDGLTPNPAMPVPNDPYGYWDCGVYRHDYRGTVVWSRDRKFRGVSTGGRRSCACGADRVFVRWDDGSRTWPCIKALDQIGPNEFMIV